MNPAQAGFFIVLRHPMAIRWPFFRIRYTQQCICPPGATRICRALASRLTLPSRYNRVFCRERCTRVHPAQFPRRGAKVLI